MSSCCAHWWMRGRSQPQQQAEWRTQNGAPVDHAKGADDVLKPSRAVVSTSRVEVTAGVRRPTTELWRSSCCRRRLGRRRQCRSVARICQGSSKTSAATFAMTGHSDRWQRRVPTGVWTFGWTVTCFMKRPIASPAKPVIREEETHEESNSNEESATLWIHCALDHLRHGGRGPRPQMLDARPAPVNLPQKTRPLNEDVKPQCGDGG
jgi:hypothetical protein